MKLSDLERLLPQRSFETLKRAQTNCEQLKNRCGEILTGTSVDSQRVCFVAIGSVGRCEALDASDLDIIPVLKDESSLENFEGRDADIRKMLQERLHLHVSEGTDLTRCLALSDLTAQDSIGGDTDSSSALTKRVLILTEGSQIWGGLSLDSVRTGILEAYAGQNRTRGRHVLSFCNDIARYYRALCIEYKAKVDVEDKDWCTRNIKLRHSRKFWYFATMLAVAAVAERSQYDTEGYTEGILEQFNLPPVLRLATAAKDLQVMSVGEVIERYAWFLEFMSTKEHRDALAKTGHADRYKPSLSNPFPVMKMNSDLLHYAITGLIEELPKHVRDRLYDWFLL